MISKNTRDIKQNIAKFNPYNEQEEVDKRIMLNYINELDNVLTRENEYGHFTSSAFVLNKERTKILMVYHNIFKSWSYTGGHSDGDKDLLHVAIKEAKEETGIKKVIPIFRDIYSIEAIAVAGYEKRGKYVGSHIHFNVTYLLEADEKEETHIKKDENSGVKWIPIEKVLEVTSEDWMRDRVYAKIIDKMKKDGIILDKLVEEEKGINNMSVKKSGCILINIKNKKIALVKRNGEYSFPKGHVEKNETLKECAKRETIEETGHDVEIIGEELSVIRYKSSAGENVENHFFVGIDLGITDQKVEEKDKEEIEWFNINLIENKLSYHNLKKFWREIEKDIKKIAEKPR